MIFTVCKLGIDFVGEDSDICIAKHLGKLLKLALCQNRACWIVRERENKKLCFVAYSLAKLLCSKLKVVFKLCFNRNNLRTAHFCNRLVANERGSRQNHLISRIDKRTDCNINSLASADSNDYLVAFVVKREFSFHIPRNFIS